MAEIAAPEAPLIVTPRLILRPWREADLEPFAEQNADSQTMQYLNGTLTRAQSDVIAARADLAVALATWEHATGSRPTDTHD